MRYKFHSKILTVAVLMLSVQVVFAQKNKKTPAVAEKAYKEKDYYTAADIYRAVFSSSKNKLGGAKLAMHQYYYAESSKKTYNFTRAQEYYGKVAKGEFEEIYPKVDYWYAYCLKHNGKYDEAIKYFKMFLDKPIKGIELTHLKLEAEHELRGCYLAIDLVENPDLLTKITHMSDEVNTKYSDFSPHLVGNKLYYSSLRFERELTRGKVVGKGQTLVGKIMIANDRGNTRFEQSKSKSLNMKYENSGNSNLNSDGSILFHTKCTYDSRREKMICQIYSAQNLGGDEWAEAIKLPDNINTEGVTSTHPAVGYDSIKQQEILYFVSERKGGMGKMDIWAAEIKGDNQYGEPYNLGELINTIGDEVSPYFHNTTQSLYYSSDHHPGLGGFDVFHCERIGDGFGESINIGIPLNSAANDLYFIINPDDSTGFFASNRPGSQILTGESCCNDIYALKLPEFPPVKIKEGPEPPLVLSDPTPEPESTPEPETSPEPEPVVEVAEIPEALQVTLDELNKLLPLSLYFHNNEPRDNQTSYSSTYNKYIEMKSKYKKEHLPQYNRSIQDQIAQNIDDFFGLKVQSNYDKMHTFFDELIIAMENEFKLAISIQGYTSPRASAEYNKALAHRRILSVSKDMLDYKDGALRPFLEAGQLMIEELPLGEGKAPIGISDDIDDPRNSIYSVEASSQRKVNFIVVHVQD